MDLDILIKTEAELQGAKAVEQQLERDIGKAKALGLRYDEIEQKLVRVRALMSTATKVDANAIDDQINKAEKLADAKLREQRIAENNKADQAGYLAGLTKEAKELGQTAQATEKVTGAKNRLFEGLKKLGNQVPIVGYLLSALKNPFTAIGVAALLAKKAIDDYVGAVDEMAESVRAVGSLQGRVTAFFDVIASSNARSDAFAESLKKIATQAGDAGDKLRQVNEQIQRQNRLAAEKEGALKALARAQIDDDESTKKISALEAAKRRAAVDVSFAAQARAREDAAETAQQVATRNAAREAAEQAETAGAALPGAKAESDVEAMRLKQLRDKVKAEQDDLAKEEALLLDEEKKLRDKLQPFGNDALGKAGQIASLMLLDRGKGRDEEARKQLEEKLEDNIQRRNSIGASRSLRDADVVKQEAIAAAAENRRKVLEDIAGRGVGTARDLNRQADEQARAIEERRAAQRTIVPIQEKADALGAGVEQRRIAREVTDKQIQAAEQLLGEVMAGNKATLELQQRILNESRSFREEIERIKNRELNRR
jgi:hypothetical protein